MGSAPEVEEDERPKKLSPGRIRALLLFARLEFVLAAAMSVGLCALRLTVFTGDKDALWAGLGVLIAPAALMAGGLLYVHSRQVGRPWPALWPELAFWTVPPTTALLLLLVT